jgi:4-amino-4-deoxy-L-arabinose transferase-like glycosyltransferase
MIRPFWFRALKISLGIVVLLTAFSTFSRAAERSRFDPDENLYMWRGRFFGHVALHHDLSGPEWADSYWTHTQPMFTNYLVGGWLWLRGYDPYQMPSPWDWGKGKQEENRRLGRVPSRELLLEARAPMVALATGSAVLLYLIGWSIGSPIAGAAAALFMVHSPLVQLFLVRALSEPPLMFWILSTLLASLWAARRARNGVLTGRQVLVVALALGLGLATKLTAGLSLAVLVIWASVVMLTGWLASEGRAAERLGLVWRVGRGWGSAMLIAAGLFVLSNPHLYPDPILHTGHLIQNRRDEMREQQRQLPGDALHEPAARVGYVLSGSFVEHTANGSRRRPIEAALAVLGLAALVVRTWQGWRATGRPPAEGLLLLTALVYFGGISAALLLAWEHYLIPTVVLGALLSGLGVGAIGQGLWTLVRLIEAKLHRRLPLQTPFPAPLTQTEPSEGTAPIYGSR